MHFIVKDSSCFPNSGVEWGSLSGHKKNVLISNKVEALEVLLHTCILNFLSHANQQNILNQVGKLVTQLIFFLISLNICSQKLSRNKICTEITVVCIHKGLWCIRPCTKCFIHIISVSFHFIGTEQFRVHAFSTLFHSWHTGLGVGWFTPKAPARECSSPLLVH
jgi:hypothetical protein